MTALRREPGQGRRFPVGPSEVTVRVDSAETGGRFALIEWLLPPGAPAPPRHVHHDASETFFVLEGELEFPMAQGAVRAPAGTSLHVPAGTVHTLANPGSGPARALELFTPGRLLGLIEEVGELLSAGGPPDPARFEAIFARHASSLAGLVPA